MTESTRNKSNQLNWQDFIFDIEFSVGECVCKNICLSVCLFVAVAVSVRLFSAFSAKQSLSVLLPDWQTNRQYQSEWWSRYLVYFLIDSSLSFSCPMYE